MNRDPRAGAALAFVLVMLLALVLLGQGAIRLSAGERLATSASLAHRQARLLAEGAVRRTFAAFADTAPAPPDTLVRSGASAPHAWTGRAWRLTEEIVWIEGSGSTVAGPSGRRRISVRAARPAWSLSPLQRVRSWSAVVHAASLGGGGAVDGTDVLRRAAVSCPDADLSAEAGRLDAWAPPADSDADSLGLGLLPGDSVLARLDHRVAGRVRPAPSEARGACRLDDPGNWGSPTDASSPCADHRPPVGSTGDLVVEGGEGQGLLVVDGDLTLDGVVYRGLILVAGFLRVEGGSEVEGLVRAGGVWIDAGSALTGDLCWPLLALGERGLGAPFWIPDAGWIHLP